MNGLMGIASIEMSGTWPGLIEVTDINGAKWFYMPNEGLLYPGRPWSLTDGKYRIYLFLPIPDGRPELLSVTVES